MLRKGKKDIRTEQAPKWKGTWIGDRHVVEENGRTVSKHTL